MKFLNPSSSMQNNKLKLNLLAILSVSFFAMVYSQNTSTEYRSASQVDLVVFHNIVNQYEPKFTKSYSIEVSSPLTNGFVPCYANVTGSLHQFITPILEGTSKNVDANKVQHYYNHVRGWTHTYGNFEMSPNSGPVTVKISLLPGVVINGSDKIISAVEHPANTVKNIVISEDGNSVTFTIDKPCQPTIDINGTMDKEPTSFGFKGTPRHTISIFANPIIEGKPAPAGDPNVAYIENGVAPADLISKRIVYFKPGAHNLGLNFKIQPNTDYYIPGDAIVYGAFNNNGVAKGRVKFYGSGTISGDLISHFEYRTDSDLQFVPMTSIEKDDDSLWKLIYGTFTKLDVIGLNLMNCPMHTANANISSGPGYLSTFDWIKIVTWRGNGDGIGSADLISNSFIRTQDDCTYVKGDRKNLILWTDVNGAAFMLAGMNFTKRKMRIENCEVIYARHIAKNWSGGRIFAKRAQQAPKDQGLYNSEVTFENIRVTDPFQTLETFQLETIEGASFSGGYKGVNEGIRFINITTARTPVPADKENNISAWSGGQWQNLTFCNVQLGEKQIKSIEDFSIDPAHLPYITNINFDTCSLGTKSFIKEQSGKIKVGFNQKDQELFIAVHNDEFEINKVALLDMSGREVYKNSAFNNKNSTINISPLSSGAYVVKMFDKDNVYTSKIIK